MHHVRDVSRDARAGGWNVAHRGAGAGRLLRVRSRTRKLYLIERPQMHHPAHSTNITPRRCCSWGRSRWNAAHAVWDDDHRQFSPEELKLAERVQRRECVGSPLRDPRLMSLLLSYLICDALMRGPNVPCQRKLSSCRFGEPHLDLSIFTGQSERGIDIFG
jgi:hypothetical protein